jgi:hypothetical protein
MALRDVRVYVDATGGTTSPYRDSNGLEADISAMPWPLPWFWPWSA